MLRSITKAIAAVSLVVLALLPQAYAQESEAAYYQGKTVRIVVGYGPGGGYDIYARMIGTYIGKALGATVVVENQPGAGGLTALNRIYSAPPDGLLMRSTVTVPPPVRGIEVSTACTSMSVST